MAAATSCKDVGFNDYLVVTKPEVPSQSFKRLQTTDFWMPNELITLIQEYVGGLYLFETWYDKKAPEAFKQFLQSPSAIDRNVLVSKFHFSIFIDKSKNSKAYWCAITWLGTYRFDNSNKIPLLPINSKLPKRAPRYAEIPTSQEVITTIKQVHESGNGRIFVNGVYCSDVNGCIAGRANGTYVVDTGLKTRTFDQVVVVRYYMNEAPSVGSSKS